MGKLIYGTSSEQLEFDDRELAHIQVVISAKLRRDEKFMLSWDHGIEKGSGHSSIWVHPSVPIRFTYSGATRPSLNREWIDQLLLTANSPGGMRIVPEPDAGGREVKD